MQPIIIATRQSPLALWQAKHISQLIQQHFPEQVIHLLPMVTSGDKASQENWGAHTGKALFIKELEEALLDGRADMAVHSMKDLSATLPDSLCLGAICERDNPFDALVSPAYHSLSHLPHGAKVGTASLRRQAQLRYQRPDLQLLPLRGNVQTRLKKLDEGAFDAIVLAAAGLNRLNLSHRISEILSPPVCIPACGQGAIGIECRQDDERTLSILKKLHCPTTQQAVGLEREVNALLGGHCHVPIGIFCELSAPNILHLTARVLNPAGTRCLEASASANVDDEDPASLAHNVAEALIKAGAQALLGEAP